MHEGDHNRGDADAARPAEIMSNLPRKRPQRRSALRDEARVQAARTEPTRTGRFDRAEEPSPPPKAPTPTPAAEPAPSLADMAVEGAVEVLKVPLKVGAEVAFKALDGIARNLRSR